MGLSVAVAALCDRQAGRGAASAAAEPRAEGLPGGLRGTVEPVHAPALLRPCMHCAGVQHQQWQRMHGLAAAQGAFKGLMCLPSWTDVRPPPLGSRCPSALQLLLRSQRTAAARQRARRWRTRIRQRPLQCRRVTATCSPATCMQPWSAQVHCFWRKMEGWGCHPLRSAHDMPSSRLLSRQAESPRAAPAVAHAQREQGTDAERRPQRCPAPAAAQPVQQGSKRKRAPAAASGSRKCACSGRACVHGSQSCSACRMPPG